MIAQKKTFTRAANAKKAAAKAIQDAETKLGFPVVVTAIDHIKQGEGCYEAGIVFEGHSKEEADKIAAELVEFTLHFEAIKENDMSETETLVKPDTDTKPDTTSGRRGPRSKLANHQLFPVAKTDESSGLPVDGDGNFINPRREGSYGWISLGLIIAKPGITTEEFLSEGGRLVDLNYDMDRDRVRAVEPTEPTAA